MEYPEPMPDIDVLAARDLEIMRAEKLADEAYQAEQQELQAAAAAGGPQGIADWAWARVENPENLGYGQMIYVVELRDHASFPVDCTVLQLCSTLERAYRWAIENSGPADWLDGPRTCFAIIGQQLDEIPAPPSLGSPDPMHGHSVRVFPFVLPGGRVSLDPLGV